MISWLLYSQLYLHVCYQIQECLSKCSPSHMGKPLMKGRLSEKQWAQVLKINEELSQEYQLRREMLLKRLDVTIQSFLWSEKAKVGKLALKCVHVYLNNFKVHVFLLKWSWNMKFYIVVCCIYVIYVILSDSCKSNFVSLLIPNRNK